MNNTPVKEPDMCLVLDLGFCKWRNVLPRGRLPDPVGAYLPRGRFRRLGVQTGWSWTKSTIGSANRGPGWTFSTIGRSKWTKETIGRRKTSPNRAKRPRGPPKDTQSCKTSTPGSPGHRKIRGLNRPWTRRPHWRYTDKHQFLIEHNPRSNTTRIWLGQRRLVKHGWVREDWSSNTKRPKQHHPFGAFIFTQKTPLRSEALLAGGAPTHTRSGPRPDQRTPRQISTWADIAHPS